MTATHRYQIYINAPRATVWEALVEPVFTREYFHGVAYETTWAPGSRFVQRITALDREAVDGVIEVCEPGERLAITWHVLYDAEMSEEPASRVEWHLTDANDDGTVTRVTLVHSGLELSPKTSANVAGGWVGIIDNLKSLLETGKVMPPFSTDAA